MLEINSAIVNHERWRVFAHTYNRLWTVSGGTGRIPSTNFFLLALYCRAQPFSKSSLVSFERPNFGVESRLSPFHCQLFLQLGNFEFNFVPSKNSYYFLAPSSDLDKTKTKRDKEMDTPMIAWFLSVVIRGDEISRSISLEEGAPINTIREKEKE